MTLKSKRGRQDRPVRIRVARWFVFKPEIPNWVSFGWPSIGNVYKFYGHLEYFMKIWDILHITIRYILHSFGTFFPVLVSCTKKNLATLLRIPRIGFGGREK
jgi:hypothetical protein